MQIIRLKFENTGTELENLPEGVTLVRTYPTLDTGEVDDEGSPIMELVPGEHYDILARDEDDLSFLNPWVVTPATPQHRFLGVSE